MKLKNNGFTLLELIIVIVIVGILSIVSVNFYEYSVEKARLTEALSTLKTIADANTLYYLEHQVWVDDISQLHLQIEGEYKEIGSGNRKRNRIETKYFIYAVNGDSANSNTIATANRKPFEERYWISYSAYPDRNNPEKGHYTVNGSATYNKSKEVDKKLIKQYLDKYSS